MLRKTQEPVRLQKAPTASSILQKDIVIRISVYTAIIMALVIFVALCFMLTQPTYGFLWY